MNKADILMKDTIDKIINEGFKDINPRPKYKDGTPAHTLSINHVVHRYDISNNEFPITTLRPIAIKNAIKEILWIYQDQSNSLELLANKYGITWWDEWESKDIPGTIGKRYGYTVKRYDQINSLLNGIKQDPYGRRHRISLWQLQDFEESDGLKPCACDSLFNVRGEYIDMLLLQRSSDWLTAGNINQMQYVALLMMVCKHCGYKPGVFTHVMANCQIYDRHMESASELLKREPINCTPILKLDTDKTDFYSFTIDDFVLTGYESMKPQIKLEIGI